MNIEVSIVIPVYNTEAYLEQCLGSILDQEQVVIEVICVNDQSPDNSLEILKRYKELFPEKIRIIDQQNTGGATAINNGIRAANGEYILIVDSDDYVLPDGLATLLHAARAESADMAVGRITRLQTADFTNAQDTSWLLHSEVLTSKQGREKLFRSKCYHGKLIKNSFLCDVGLLMVDGLLYADGPFVSKLYVEAGTIVLVADNVVVWRKRDEGAPRSITDRKLELSTLDDHIRSLGLSLDNAQASGERAFVTSLAQVDGRRPIWHLLPAWRAGTFSLSYLKSFYEATDSYYARFRGVKFSGQPKAEALLIWALVGQRKIVFFLMCLVLFLAYQANRLKKYLKAVGKEFIPVSLMRQLRKWIPNYVGHTIFRPFLKYIPQHQHMVIFESFFGKSYSGNPKYLFEAMKTHYPHYTCVWVNSGKPLEIPGCMVQVKRGSHDYYYYLARAKYWINNIQFPVHEKPKGAIYLQTWHGTPLKHLGFDIDVEGPEAEVRERAFRESRNWDFLLAQNSYSAEIFQRCFQYEGEVIEEGYPLNAPFFDPDIEQRRVDIKHSLGIPKEKKVYLYAPTWRDNNRVTSWEFEPDNVFDFEQWCERAPGDCILLIKYHHLVKPPEILGFEGKIISVSDYGDTQELMLITDCLITDYSSIFFDFLNCDKPMIFYAYDIGIYTEKTRNMYMAMKDLPGPVVSSFDELLDCAFELDTLRADTHAKRRVFSEKFCVKDDIESSQRILEKVLG